MIIWFITITSLLIGYVIGREIKPKQEYDRILKDIKKRSIKVGTISRPTPETIATWNTPGKEEEEEAFKESFTRDLGDPTK